MAHYQYPDDEDSYQQSAIDINEPRASHRDAPNLEPRLDVAGDGEDKNYGVAQPQFQRYGSGSGNFAYNGGSSSYSFRSSQDISVEGYGLSPVLSHQPVRMQSLSKTKSSALQEEQLQDLREMGFPRGLAEELGRTRALYPVRFWILDNSGSMMANDGASVRGSISVQCTRWAELQECVNYHTTLAGTLQATTIFHMLNDPGARVGPQVFSIAEQGRTVMEEVQMIKNIMHACQPHGSTPLTAHLIDIGQRIASEEPNMRRKGLEAVVIIATDGLPTSPEGLTSEEVNNEFIAALQHLQTLPVWIVIRLCTDERDVVDFYNHLDKVLELPIEVLDDFFNEAKEIHKQNKWLNYAMPLHRCREIGYQHRIFDLLDERPLNKDEVKEFCAVLLGEDHFMFNPDVHSDWNGFCKLLSKIVKEEAPQFNPVTKKMGPWIDVNQLKKHFSGGVMGIFKKKSGRLST